MGNKEPFKITSKDKKRYVLGEERDCLILEKIYRLEKHPLSLEDKKTTNLIRTQLEKDWRAPLLQALNRLLRKYNHKK